MGKPGRSPGLVRNSTVMAKMRLSACVCAVVFSVLIQHGSYKKKISTFRVNWVNRRQLFSLTVALQPSPYGPPGGSMWLRGLKIQYPRASLSPQGLGDHAVLGDCVMYVCVKSFFSATSTEYKFHKISLWAFGCLSHAYLPTVLVSSLLVGFVHQDTISFTMVGGQIMKS